MYADDIILLSSTAEGLQAKLDILDSNGLDCVIKYMYTSFWFWV
jgi:hypothetical protein